MRTANRTNGGLGGVPIDARAVLSGLIMTAVLLILCSALLTAFGITAGMVPSVRLLRTLVFVCMAGGGYLAGRKCASRSWLNGILSALVGFILLAWLTGGPAGEATPWLWFRTILLVAFLGMVGGIIGGLQK